MVRYIIDATPDQAGQIQAALAGVGVDFHPTLNLIAMPRDNIEEGIFQGNDLDWLPETINDHLQQESNPVRVQEHIAELDLQTKQDFLTLVTLHAEWDNNHTRIDGVSEHEWQKFQDQHPLAVHPAGETPAPTDP